MSRFLVFEGLDGSGKSSLMRALEKELTDRGLPFHHTREPGGTPLGEQLRHMILKKSEPVPVPRAELLLYEADRAQHVETVIKPKLASNVWVLSDRYDSSSIAFQAGGRAISEKDVRLLNKFATGDLKPHLTVLLDLPIAKAKARRAGREDAGGEEADRMESESDRFHEAVRKSYLAQAKKNPSRWLVLNAASTPEALFGKLMKELKRRKWLD